MDYAQNPSRSAVAWQPPEMSENAKRRSSLVSEACSRIQGGAIAPAGRSIEREMDGAC